MRAFIANVQRADLDPIEEAHAVAQMRDLGLSIETIARHVGWSIATVSARLKLLDLEPEVQQLVSQSRLPRDSRVSTALLRIPSSAARVKLARRLARPGVSIPAIVRAAEKLTERLTAEQTVSDAKSPATKLAGQLPPATQTAHWKTVKAAAEGMCTDCDVNPRLPAAPDPAWALVLHSAESTCDACAMNPKTLRSLNVCEQCPAVDLLKRLANAGKRGD